MKAIDFKTAPYFSSGVIFTGMILLVTGAFLLFVDVIAGLFLCLVSAVILTTHYRLSVNFDSKVYHDYVWILGLKNGSKTKFNTIEYIFIKKGKVTQTMQLRVVSTTLVKEFFHGYLKFADNQKIHLVTKESKEDLVETLRTVSKQLGVRIIDYSSGHPLEIKH